jgi:sugar lactone lactonase YvrE
MALASIYLTTPSISSASNAYVPPVVVTSTSAVPATGLPGNLGNVALDACGNIYAMNEGSGLVVEIPYGGGAATTVFGPATSGYGSSALAIDSAKANLFVIPQEEGNVVRIPIANCVPQTASSSNIGIGNLGSVSWYWAASAVATDSSGDLFIGTSADCCASGNELIEEYAGYNSGATLLVSLANNITSIALDASKNIYYVSGGALFELPLATAATSGAPATYAATPVPFGGTYISVVGVSFDGAGNLYVADAGNSAQYSINGWWPPIPLSSTLYVIPYETSALNPADQYIVAQGSGVSNPLSFGSAVAIAPTGGIFFADSVYNNVFELTQFSSNLGSVALGSTGNGTLNVFFNAPETPSSISFASNSSFASTGGTCATGTAYTSGQSCTIASSFTPSTPGTASSGVTLAYSAGSALVTTYLDGTGLGAGLTVDTGVISPVGGGFTSPASVALDAAGNSYFADSGANAVLEFAPGGTTAIKLGTGLKGPLGVAVDGEGNVIVADTGNNQIVEVPVVSGAPSNAAQVTVVSSSTSIAGSALSGPSGVTVDGQGNLYIADTGNNRVVYLPYNGSWDVAQASVIASNLTAPLATGLDPSGNLYVADSGTGQIYKVPAPVGSGVQQLVAVGYNNPSALAADASGSLYVVNQGASSILRIPNLSGSLSPNNATQVGIGNARPYGIALDKSGNIYVADSSAAAAYLIARTGTTESFGDWAVGSPSGALPVKVENEGNQALVFASPYYTATGNTADFSLSSPSSECASGGTVAVGAGCELDAVFTPTASGSRTETLTLNSNAANAASAQVVLTGSGIAAASTSTALAVTSPASGSPFFGEPITLTATVTSSSGTPTGSAQLLVDGVIAAQSSLSGSGVATFSLATGLTGGSHSLQAVYLGSSAFDGSTSSALALTVTTAPTVSTMVISTEYTNPYSIVSGGSAVFTVTISSTGVGIPTGTVIFSTGSTSLATVPVVPVAGGAFQAALTTSALPVGTDLVTATYSGDANYVTSSTSGTVYVVAASTVVVTQSGSTLTSSGSGTASASNSVTFTPTSYGGWTGVVGYQCVASTLPANANCVFAPGQVSVSVSTASAFYPLPTTNMYVVVNNPPNSPVVSSMLWWLGGISGLFLFWVRRRMMRGAWRTVAILVGAIALSIAGSGLMACSDETLHTTPAGSGTITVIASADPYVPNEGQTTYACGTSALNNPEPNLAPCSETTFQIPFSVK